MDMPFLRQRFVIFLIREEMSSSLWKVVKNNVLSSSQDLERHWFLVWYSMQLMSLGFITDRSQHEP